MDLRQRLYISKDKALKGSSNLFISKTRLQIRNLPRKEFYEPELKELMRVVCEEWSKTLSAKDKALKFKNKKLIAHVKVMRDEQKQDPLTNQNLPSGLAFVEFANEEVAMFAVRYLNNFEVVPTKGLIVDFSMEDQRALFKRKEKIERWRQIAKDKKKEEDEQMEEVKPAYKSNEPLDLGEYLKSKKNIQEVTKEAKKEGKRESKSK
jgi:RNA recognition motif-containing protein